MTDDARAWFLLTPPEPPFIAVMKTIKKSQHLIWRAPMTYSLEAIQLRFGPNLLVIRHSVLMKAVKVCREVGAAIMSYRDEQQGKGKKKSAKVVGHPFAFLSRDLKDPRGGRFIKDALDLAIVRPDIADKLDFLRRLNDGELWALATLCQNKPPTATKPEPIDLVSTK